MVGYAVRTFLIYDGTHSVPYITALTRLWANSFAHPTTGV